MSDDLVKRWDEYVESMGCVMGEVEHMAQQMRDRIEELAAERDEAWRRAAHAEKMWGEAEVKLATCKKYRDAYAEFDRIATQAVRDLEAKLAKAVEPLEAFKEFDDLPTAAKRPDVFEIKVRKPILLAIAELTGGKNG